MTRQLWHIHLYSSSIYIVATGSVLGTVAYNHRSRQEVLVFGLGTGELFLILIIVLVIFGAGKLPEIGGALGRGIRSFKKEMNGTDSSDKPTSENKPKSGEE